MAKEYIERETVRNELYDADAITMSGVVILNNLPAADVVEVRHGEWIIETPNKCKFITCSACCSVIDCLYTNIDEHEFDYCPYCGAKMDGKGYSE